MCSLWRLWHAATKDGVILGGELNRETNEGSTDRHWTDDRLLLLLLSGCLTVSLCPPSLSLVVSAIIRLGYQYNLNSNISPCLPSNQRATYFSEKLLDNTFSSLVAVRRRWQRPPSSSSCSCFVAKGINDRFTTQKAPTRHIREITKKQTGSRERRWRLNAWIGTEEETHVEDEPMQNYKNKSKQHSKQSRRGPLPKKGLVQF